MTGTDINNIFIYVYNFVLDTFLLNSASYLTKRKKKNEPCQAGSQFKLFRWIYILNIANSGFLVSKLLVK